MEIVKTILSLPNIDYENIKNNSEQLIQLEVNNALGKLNQIIIVACPFLSYMPFAAFFLTKIEMILFNIN